MTKYEWTDWITHVPGQRPLVGLYIRAECHGKYCRGGKPYTTEGIVTSGHLKNPCWAMADIDGIAVKVLRYKIRVQSEDQEAKQDETIAA
jgi:hypothetical protein